VRFRETGNLFSNQTPRRIRKRGASSENLKRKEELQKNGIS